MHLSPRNSAASRQAILRRGRSLFATSVSTRRSRCNLNDRNITNRTRWNNMGLSWQQGPLSTGAIGRFLVPEPLPKRLLYVEPLRRRMRGEPEIGGLDGMVGAFESVYFRVLQEGEVGAGDEIAKVGETKERMTVAETNALLYSPNHPRDRLERALRVEALSPGWRSSFEALLLQSETSVAGSGNA